MKTRVAVSLVAVLLAGCVASSDPLPTENEARALLDEIVGLTSEGHLDELCALGASNCARFLQDAGSPPPQAPVVIGTRTIQPVTTGSIRSVGGVVIELCGENQGEVYYTEVLVFRESGELHAAEPVYWSGFRIGEDSTVGEPVPDAETLCGDAV